MNWLLPAGITFVVGVGLALTRRRVRFLGDKAQVGDEVQVPASFVAGIAGLEGLAAALAPTATGVGFRVLNASALDTLRATPVAVFIGPTRTPLTIGGGEIDLPRAAVSGLYRDGKAIS